MGDVDLPICDFPGCGRRFSKLKSLKLHKFTHDTTLEKPHKCDVKGCAAAYASLPHLKRHKIKTHSREVEGEFKCTSEGCVASFDTKFLLRQHANRTHNLSTIGSNGDPLAEIYECQLCNVKFTKKYKLQQHTAIHTNVKPFKCEQCGDAFDMKFQYNNHINAHRKEAKKNKTHDCDKCSVQFTSYKGLMIHRKLKHPTVYKCEQCGLNFANNGILKAHKDTHSSIRTVFHCSVENCTKVYYYERGLSEHFRRVHSGVSYICPYCDKKLCSKQKLENHMKLHSWIPRVLPPRPPVKKESQGRKYLRKNLKHPFDPATLFIRRKPGRKRQAVEEPGDGDGTIKTKAAENSETMNLTSSELVAGEPKIVDLDSKTVSTTLTVNVNSSPTATDTVAGLMCPTSSPTRVVIKSEQY